MKTGATIHFDLRATMVLRTKHFSNMDTARDTCVHAAQQADEAADALKDCLESMAYDAMLAVDSLVAAAARICAATEEPARAAIATQQRSMEKRVKDALEECEANADLLCASARAGPGPTGTDGLLHVDDLPGSFVVVCPDADWIEEQAQPYLLLHTAVPDGEWDEHTLYAGGTVGVFTYYTNFIPVFAKFVTVVVPDMPPGATFVAQASDVPDGVQITYQFTWTSAPSNDRSVDMQVMYGDKLLCSTNILVLAPWKTGSAALHARFMMTLALRPVAYFRYLDTMFGVEALQSCARFVKANEVFNAVVLENWVRADCVRALRTLRTPTVMRWFIDFLNDADEAMRDVDCEEYPRSYPCPFAALPEYADAKRRFGF